MKKKIVNVVLNVPILLLGITFLAIQEYLIGFIMLVIVSISFYYITTSNGMNINSRIKNVIISYIVVFLIACLIGTIIDSINSYKSNKIYEKAIARCHTLLNEQYDYESFENLIEEYGVYSKFAEEGYSILEKSIDEKIEQAKQGTNNKEFVQMLNGISIEKYSVKTNIETKVKTLKLYHSLVEVDEYIKNQDYINAYSTLNNILYDCEDEEVKNIATLKQNDIKSLLVEQVIAIAQKEINRGFLESAKSTLADYKYLNDEKINTMYNQVTDEVYRIEQEKIAKERFEYEVYCYFGLIAWKEKETITDDIAYTKCASKFGITKEDVAEIYDRVSQKGWWYQDEYPDIFEKYASQYYN